MSLRRIILSLAATAIMAVGFNASGADKSLGVSAGYNSRSESPTAGMWFEYSLTDCVRLSPSIDYYFRHNDVDAVAINCNVHLPVSLAPAGTVKFYPLAGLNYTSWNFRTGVGDDRSSTRNNRFGLNVGAGIEFRMTPTMKVFAQGKGIFVKSYSSAAVAIGLGYVF